MIKYNQKVQQSMLIHIIHKTIKKEVLLVNYLKNYLIKIKKHQDQELINTIQLARRHLTLRTID